MKILTRELYNKKSNHLHTYNLLQKHSYTDPVSEPKLSRKQTSDYYTSVDTAKAPREVRYQATPTSLQDRDGVVVTTLIYRYK